jgi:hypothetical protein
MNSAVSYDRLINLSATDRGGRAARISDLVAFGIAPISSSSPSESAIVTGSGSGSLGLSSMESFKPAIYGVK